MGLGEVRASHTRPRHTWETGKGEEREQQWLKRQRREQVVGTWVGGMRQEWGRRGLGGSHARGHGEEGTGSQDLGLIMLMGGGGGWETQGRGWEATGQV